MTDKFLIGFDGTESSNRAIEFAAACAKGSNAQLHLVMVLEWSPYSFQTPDELSERHKRREQELGRATDALKPVAEGLNADGVETSFEVRHGHAADILCEIAKDDDVVQIFIGRTGNSTLTARLLGGLAISLAQVAPVPVTIVP